jgi:hypothetical protein
VSHVRLVAKVTRYDNPRAPPSCRAEYLVSKAPPFPIGSMGVATATTNIDTKSTNPSLHCLLRDLTLQCVIKVAGSACHGALQRSLWDRRVAR